MLTDEGKPRKKIFKKDNLHMTGDGYVIWRDTLRPILMKSELRYEAEKPTGSSETKEETSNSKKLSMRRSAHRKLVLD